MTRMTDRAAEGVELPCKVEALLERGVPLWQHTSIRVGGPARFYARPAGPDDLRSLLRWSRRNDRPHALLGGGSNVVFPETGYDGLIIRTTGLRGRFIEEGTRARVAAGERLAEVAWWATRLGLSGLEWACGIPGSIGGAVVMNAGARGGDVEGVLSSVEILAEEHVLTVPAELLRLGYRTSALLTGDLRGILIEATFVLRRAEPAACLARARSSIAERLRNFPVGASAGCIFRNPPTGPTAGQLLDHAGCKGLRVGRATVSVRHANVILNEGSDNASDVLKLIDRMKDRVLTSSGAELREEVIRFDRGLGGH